MLPSTRRYIILHIAGFRDIGVHEPRIATALTHQFDAALALSLIEIDNDHLSAALSKAKCAGAADATTAAGDQRNLTREFHRKSPEKVPG